MVVHVIRIEPNGLEDDDFLSVHEPASSLTIKKLRTEIEDALEDMYTRDEYVILKTAESDEPILDEWDEKTVAEVLNENENGTLFVMIRTLAGVRIKVTNKTPYLNVPLIKGKSKRWEDIDLVFNSKTVIELVKDRWWRNSNKGKTI